MKTRKLQKLIFIVIIVLVSVVNVSADTSADIELMEVHFIDVGHGDSIFIDYGNYEILIDAGDTSKGKLVSQYINPYIEDDLDLVIATHAHKDHVGGLPQIFQDYQVNKVIDSGSFLDTKEWRAYKESVENEPDCMISYDVDWNIGIGDKVQINIIEALDGQKNENNNSVTALLTYNNVSVLLTGDNEAEAEAIIAQKVGEVDVFKGAHHGSYNANSKKLLNIIRPRYVVISAGEGENYNHPHDTALRRMFNVGAIVYGTFKSGTIVMRTDGDLYSFDTAISERATSSKPIIPLQIIDSGNY